MRRRQGARAPEGFSLSFLDVICCGFGAVILLLMITKTVEPQIIEASTVNLEGRLADLQEQLFELRGETRILNRDLNARQEQLSEYEERIAILQGLLASARSRHDSIEVQTNSNSIVSEELALARQALTDEMQRLLGLQYESKNQLIGGIPVDSEYVIFIIDSSGSMQGSWDRVLQEVESVLNLYPEVKGVQVLNGEGTYMFNNYAGRWIQDTPSRRAAIMRGLRNWRAADFSILSKGIERAVREFYEPGRKISIYVFGDEFAGPSISDVVDRIDFINREDGEGNRYVRIHAVGFQTPFVSSQRGRITSARFASLMRELTHRNGGAFVALTD